MTSPPSSTVGVMHPSEFNALRVSTVAERLSAYFKGETASSNAQIPNSMEYFNLLLSLSRGIDYSIANNEIPPKAEELPKVLNEIRLRKADACTQGIIMVLMISVKNACRAGWFHEKDSQELIAYTDEITSCFCDKRNISDVTSESHSAMLTILSRFYPQMRMGHVLASLEVQPGFGAIAVDFLISKGTTRLPEEKIMLFVARMDSIETSACIITPQQANFLLNGKGVERRTNVFLDPGPQMPNNVTSLLKYGTNLLQAVGQFNGHYVVYVAFMSTVPQPEPTVLQDYVPVVSTLDSDSDLIEGQSRISLNCPISRTRIQVPVKGCSCKHRQCFDYSNFLGINSRRPSWRCPHCNNYVCFTDLRIDQIIAKVLREVGGHVSDVLISADGSWKAILESDNDDPDPLQPQVLENQASVGSPNPILDLTEDNDAMDIMLSTENDDIKPLQQLLTADQQLPTADTQMNNVNLDDEFFSGMMEFVAGNPTSAVFKDTNITAVGNPDGLVNADSGSGQKEVRNSVQAVPTNFPTPSSVPRLRAVIPVLSGSSSATVPSVPTSTEVRVDSEKQRFASPRSNSSLVQPGLSQHSSAMQGRTSHALPAGWPSPAQQTPPVQNPNSSKPNPGRFSAFQNAHLQQAFNNTTRTPLLARPSGPVSETGGPPGIRIRVPVPQTTPGQVPRMGTSVPPGFQPSKPAPTGPSEGGSDESWRPSGRMRGSLAGRALPGDISQLIIQPSRGAGGPPPSNLSAPPHLQKSVPNRNNVPSASASGTGNSQNPPSLT